jgi:CubicO group peptidase (beta-lactamase class C family)
MVARHPEVLDFYPAHDFKCLTTAIEHTIYSVIADSISLKHLVVAAILLARGFSFAGTQPCWSQSGAVELENALKNLDTKTLIVRIENENVFTHGNLSKKYPVYSVRKSLLSSLFGAAVEGQLVQLNSNLGQLGIDDIPPLTAKEKTATVKQLLSSSSGVYHQAAYETKRIKETRPERGEYEPGEHWFYNNWDFNVLGTIYERATHSKIGADFKQKIAAPIGMEDFEATDVEYVKEDSSVYPAYPFKMTARDLAKFGQLYLNHGRWNGKPIVSEKWVDESTKVQAFIDEKHNGYGYMWNVYRPEVGFKGVDLGPGSFSANGNKGQYVVVIPSRKMVVVHQVEKPGEVTKREFAQILKKVLSANVCSPSAQGPSPRLQVQQGANH